MATQLLILYGSSPGAGKSTFASFLFERYCLREHPVEWLYEDDVLSLPLSEPVVEAVQHDDRRLKDIVLETAVQFTNIYHRKAFKDAQIQSSESNPDGMEK